MSNSSTALAHQREFFADQEALALVGFLAGYSGLTRDAYSLDLRQYATWCAELRLPLFAARRAHIEGFARDLEAHGRSRATIARRLCTVTCFYRYAEQEGLIEHSRRCTCDDRASTTSRTPSGWTATSSGRCSSPPVSPVPATMR